VFPHTCAQARPSEDAVFIRLAQTVYEASRTSNIRFQGVYVNGGVDEDATMNYWVRPVAAAA
jgi:hypothetical protein